MCRRLVALVLMAAVLWWPQEAEAAAAMAATANACVQRSDFDRGYWVAAADGSVFAHGDAPSFGSPAGTRLNRPIVGLDSTPYGNGYWLVASDGGVFNYGDAKFYGSTGHLVLNKPITGVQSTPGGYGYWMVASDGGIFAFGEAAFYGSTGSTKLNQPIVGMASTPSGKGYWLVASDGGIFAYGDAGFHGSTGSLKLNRPIVGMAPTPSGKGYWLVASDGGVFAYGDAHFFGSTGDIRLNQPIVAMAATDTGRGYWFTAADGGVFAFGDAPFLGAAALSCDGRQYSSTTSPVVAIVGHANWSERPMPSVERTLFVDKDSTQGTCSDTRTVAQVTRTTPWCSLAKALSDAPPSSQVKVAPGTYPNISDQRVRTGWVSFVPLTAGTVTLSSVSIGGGQFLSFTGFRIVGSVSVSWRSISQAARNVIIADNDMSSTGTCLTLRNGAGPVWVENNAIHDCNVGIAGPGDGISDPSKRLMTHHIVIRNNDIRRMVGDGIQFGHWQDVLIEGNRIDDIDDPANVIHNDALQITGNTHRVRIVRNHMSDSTDQLILIKDDIGDSVAANTHLLLENNLLHGAGAVGLQLSGTWNAYVINNVVWDTYYAAVYVRGGVHFNTDDTVVANNIFKSISVFGGAKTRFNDNNVLGGDPKFVDAPGGNFRLQSGSPARGAAAAQWLPAVDIAGAARAGTNDIGPYRF